MAPNKAMPYDKGQPYWQHLSTTLGEVEHADTNGILNEALRTNAASQTLLASLQQQHNNSLHSMTPHQLVQRNYGNPYACAMTQGMPGNTMSAHHTMASAKARQGIDNEVLGDLYRLLGNAVIPQPRELNATSQAMHHAPEDQLSTLDLTYNLPGSMGDSLDHRAANGVSLFASMAAKQQSHQNQNGLYSQQRHQQLLPDGGSFAMQGTTALQQRLPQWNSSGLANGNNFSATSQQILGLSNQEASWLPDASFRSTDYLGVHGGSNVSHDYALPEEHGIVPKRPKQPLRALSAYNFFFRDERDRIVTETEGQYETTAAKKEQLLAGHWYRDRTKKRRHRKTHGKIAFTELSKVISSRWKDLADDLKAFYRDVAAEDLMRYHRELDEQKSLHSKEFGKRNLPS